MIFFGPSMMEKTVVEARGGKFRGVPGYGGRSGLSDARFSRTRTCVLKEICPRGNNKVLYISLYHDKCLLFMLELY